MPRGTHTITRTHTHKRTQSHTHTHTHAHTHTHTHTQNNLKRAPQPLAFSHAPTYTKTHTRSFCNSFAVLKKKGWQRPIGCLVFIGHFSQKRPIISGSFVERDVQLNAFYASSPPCIKSASSGWRRHMGCLIFIGHFPQKSPIISGSFAKISSCFAKKDVQLNALNASSPTCIKSTSSRLLLRINRCI